MIYGRWGVVDPANSGYSGVTTNTFGNRIPWDFGLRAGIQYMSSGPNDQVAAEIQSYDPNKPDHWIETYRRVPGRVQWVRSGKIEVSTAKQPNWLADGRLVYLRDGGDGTELWVSNADGSAQRKAVTIKDLKPFEEKPVADWFTIDQQGRNIYYLSGNVIRHKRVEIPH